jgi:xylulokinase
MEYGDASGTGLLDIRRRTWHAEAVAAIDEGLMERLPAVEHPEAAAGRMKHDFAADFGLKSVLVASGGGDNMMGAIGTGNISPGVCTVSLGTSGTIYSYFDRPFSDPRGEIAAFCDSTGGWLPLLCTMNVTNATELWKGLLRIDSDARDALAVRAAAGSDGLLFLPYVDGERVPPLPEASAVFFGLNRSNFRAEAMTRAVMEGTVLNLGYGFGRLRELGLHPSQIRATGGGAQSPFWLGLVADILATPVVTLAEQEAAAFGAALQAVWCLRRAKGEAATIADLAGSWVRLGETSAEPDPARAGLYAEIQERFNRLWRTLVPEFAGRV